jgi:hypothetical protein
MASSVSKDEDFEVLKSALVDDDEEEEKQPMPSAQPNPLEKKLMAHFNA